MLNIRRLLQGLVLVAPVIATLLVPTAGTAAANPIQPVGPIALPPMPTLVAVVDQQLLTDPGFEGTTPSGWIKTEGAFVTSNVHKCGNRSISLGALGNAFFFQDVAIPANATSPNLSFYLRIDSNVVSTSAVDTLEVLIKTAPALPMTGTTLATLATYSNLDTTNSQFLRRGNFDLSNYKGQTVRVWFQGSFAQHVGQSTQFFIDDTAVWTRQRLSLNFC
jgi:hypothetical protein